ncbi:MAG: hypothetical protein EXS29_06970 [Pedosphaera sp.]|nr:hypothetical protein [Pedosphaera sp.]
MNPQPTPEQAAKIVLIVISVAVLVGIPIWLFFSYCLKRICLKAGHEPGALVWIPVAQIVPLLTVAGLPLWWIILCLIPCVSIFVFCYIWFKICERLGHGVGFVVGIILLPIVFIPVLAFGQSPNQVEQAQ